MYKVYANGTLIHDLTRVEDSYHLLNGNVKAELNKAGSFDFTILPSHPFYDQLEQMKTVVWVTRGDVEIFRGRVLQISDDMYKQRKVYCEGNLSFFVDSIMDPVLEEVRTKAAHFRAIIENHNKQVETFKQFTAGNIVVDDPEKEETFYTSSYQNSQQALEALIKDYRGYLVTRTVGETTYLDWIKEYNHTATQPIQLSVNMMDFSHERSVDDLYTVLYPTGEDDLKITEENDGSPYIQNDSMVAKYGKIVHHESFGGIDDAKELKKKATEFFTEYLKDDKESYSVKAIDLHFLDNTYDQILLGDKVHIVNAAHSTDINRICTSVSFSITNPESDSYEFGNTYQSLAEKHLKDAQKTKEKEDGLAREQKSISDTLKISQSHIVLLQENVDILGQNVEVNTQTLLLKAEKRDVDALDEELREVGIQLDGVEASLALYATKSEVATFGTQVDELSIRLDTAESQILLKADQTIVDFQGERIESLEEHVGSADARLNSAEIAINAANAQIQLKASQTDYLALADNVDAFEEATEGNFENLETRMSQAEIDIDGVESSITLKADKIYVDGQIQTLSANMANIQNEISNNIDTKNLTATQSIQAANLYVGVGIDNRVPVSVALRDVKIKPDGNNTYKLYAQPLTTAEWVEKGSFSRATTLSRAWSGGTVTVSASPQGNELQMSIYDVVSGDVSWDGNTASFPVYTNLDGNETKYNTGKTLHVDATARYNAGVTAGRSAARLTLNTDEHEISIGSSGSLTSVGISSTVSLTYNSSNHKYTAISTAKAGSTTMATSSTVSGVEAFNAGVSSARLAIDTDDSTIVISSSGTLTEVGLSLSSSAFTATQTSTGLTLSTTATMKANDTTMRSITRSLNLRKTSVKYASTLNLWRDYLTALAYYDDDADKYISAGTHYWYWSNTKGYNDVYTYLID